MSAARRKKVKAEVWGSSIQGEMWALPATPEAYDAMVEQMAEQMFYDDASPAKEPLNRADWMKCCFQIYYTDFAKVALRAIGITRPKHSTRNKETRK